MTSISSELAAVLGNELLRRAAEDFRLSQELHDAPADHRLKLYQTCCRENADALREIIANHGWPTCALVGDEASTAAVKIVLHATHDAVFQAECRDLVAAAVDDGASPGVHLAYLDDLRAVAAGEPQPFGTQMNLRTGHPHPIRDPERLDERRAQLGLEPYRDFVHQLRRRSGA